MIKNPVESHLPTGCVKIATSFHAELADVRELIPTSQPIVFVVGAMSHGSVSSPANVFVINTNNYIKLYHACSQTTLIGAAKIFRVWQ